MVARCEVVLLLFWSLCWWCDTVFVDYTKELVLLDTRKFSEEVFKREKGRKDFFPQRTSNTSTKKCGETIMMLR